MKAILSSLAAGVLFTGLAAFGQDGNQRPQGQGQYQCQDQGQYQGQCQGPGRGGAAKGDTNGDGIWKGSAGLSARGAVR